MDQTPNPSQEREEWTRPKTRGDERRHSLIEAAYKLISEKGFEGLRVRDVAASIGNKGVNIATLHYYFKTKEALIQGVVDHLLDQFISFNAQTPPGEQQTPAEQVRQMFVDVQSQMQTRPEMFIVLAELNLHAQRNPAVKTSVNGMLRHWREHIEGVCRAGVEQGFFNPDLDIPRVATVLMALIEGLSLKAITELEDREVERIGSDMVDWLTKPRKK